MAAGRVEALKAPTGHSVKTRLGGAHRPPPQLHNSVGFSIAYTVAADTISVNQSTKASILSVFYYGYACSQVPSGYVAQKIGGRKVLLLSFLLWSFTCTLLPLDPNCVSNLIIARLLVGVAQGFIFPYIHIVLAQWVPPHERSRFVSLTTSGIYLGVALSVCSFYLSLEKLSRLVNACGPPVNQ